MINEPNIIINGHLLTEGQASTVRVAVEVFAADLTTNGLGDDEHGEIMAKSYLARISELRKLMGFG